MCHHSPLAAIGKLTGHEDWITCINSYYNAIESVLYVVSGSQDSKIRLWRICVELNTIDIGVVDAVTTTTAVSPGISLSAIGLDIDDDDEAADDDDVQAKDTLLDEEDVGEARLVFSVGGTRFLVFLEALLIAHEDWITSIHWLQETTVGEQKVRAIFSTSMDRNMIIWLPDEASGIWLPQTRIGDIGGTLGGSVGGNLLGFCGAAVCSTRNTVLGIGYGGSFHMWSEDGQGHWSPRYFSSGHFSNVNDIQWASSGNYLLSASSDQTCRLFGEVTSPSHSSWCEVSRPQIHGYDLNCIAMSPDAQTLYSGSDEKLIRIFETPLIVKQGLSSLCGIQLDVTVDATVERESEQCVHSAYIPELGLSNKSTGLMSATEVAEMAARGVSGLDWSAPPLEGQLADWTVWPEVRKLYGHTNDVQCMAVSYNGRLLASACRARDQENAGIILWDTQTYQSICTLEGHESTVACISFSNDDKYISSSGKDRSLCIFAIDSDEAVTRGSSYTIVKKAHKRIVWGCSWSAANDKLVTVSRDGSAKLWEIGTRYNPFCTCILEFSPFSGAAVTAVDILTTVRDRIVLAVGSEEGDLSVWALSSSNEAMSPAYTCSTTANGSHGLAVTRIRWRPNIVSGEDEVMHSLASCGEDNCVRIHKVRIE